MVRIKDLEEIPEVSNTDEIAISDTSLNQDKKVTIEDLRSVNADTKFYLDGAGGSTYFIYVSATDALQLWKNGTLVSEW